jgi:hypothetical protein
MLSHLKHERGSGFVGLIKLGEEAGVWFETPEPHYFLLLRL